MTNTIVNSLIAGVVGVVAFIAVRAILQGAGADCCGDALTNTTVENTSVIVGDCGCICCDLEGSLVNCTYNGVVYENSTDICAPCIECWTSAQCALTLTIIPLAVAIFTVVTLFFALSKMRGV